MTRSVFQATRASDLHSAAVRWIEPLLGKSEIVIVTATRACGDEFVRALPAPGAFGIHRFTVVQLAAVLARPKLAEEGVAPATHLATEAIAARVTHAACSRGQLQYFGPIAKSPGFPRALASTIGEIRLAGISPPTSDIALLAEEYERELVAAKLADLAWVFQVATGLAQTGDHRFAGLPLLLLDPLVPSQAHEKFIDALAGRSPHVFFASIAAAPAPAPRHTRSLDRLREYLFAPAAAEPSDYDDSLQLFSAPGEPLEAVEIARRIALSNIPFDRIAILLRNPERYQPLIEEALRRAGIPAYFSRGTARPNASGRAFLALLACASEGCSASRFAEYLSLGQVPPLDATGAPPRREVPWVPTGDELLMAFDDTAVAREAETLEAVQDATVIATPLAWEKLLVDAAVIGGYERWARRLRGLENEFRIQLASLAAADHAERERLERELERLASLESFALPLIEDLHALPYAANWRDWLDGLSRLAARALVDPEPVLQVLAELRPMAQVGPVGLDEVYRVLAGRLRVLRVEPPHRRYGGVFVGAIDEARGRTFEIVFLPGLAEGLFPRKASEDALLLDNVRRSLSPHLATNRERIARERLLLHTAAASAGSRFIASYPSMDLAQGRPRVPSFYALEIARAIEGRVPALRPFEARLSASSEARLVWPAPEDPLHAIDDAEYDLSWLAAHRGERGSARYLIEVNPRLGRSLRTRWKRWEPAWTPADGFAHVPLPDLRPSVHEYSPSALQHFAACPYRFMLNAVLRLRERQQPAAIEQLDPLTRGALFHEVQREFLTEWRREPSSDWNTLYGRLEVVLLRVSEEYREKIAPAIARVWESDLEDLRNDLRGWLSLWSAGLEEWEPLHFELGFGLGDGGGAHDPASCPEPVQIGAARVRGSIDLVERHRQRGSLRITDHKTGKRPDRQPTYIAGGTVLQPVLYALAAERMLSATAESGRLFYCTQRGNYVQHSIEMDRRARDYFARGMAVIEESLSTGFLPAAPAEKACALCEYSAVCGPNEERRVKRWKDREALDSLNELRCMP